MSACFDYNVHIAIAHPQSSLAITGKARNEMEQRKLGEAESF